MGSSSDPKHPESRQSDQSVPTNGTKAPPPKPQPGTPEHVDRIRQLTKNGSNGAAKRGHSSTVPDFLRQVSGPVGTDEINDARRRMRVSLTCLVKTLDDKQIADLRRFLNALDYINAAQVADMMFYATELKASVQISYESDLMMQLAGKLPLSGGAK